jgi:hypothetical protein
MTVKLQVQPEQHPELLGARLQQRRLARSRDHAVVDVLFHRPVRRVLDRVETTDQFIGGSLHLCHFERGSRDNFGADLFHDAFDGIDVGHAAVLR